MNKVVVIDYGIGNVFSVCNALKKIGEEPVLTNKTAEISAADRIILPGVGAFGKAVDALKAQGLDDVLKRYKDTGRPFLGICVGMQMAMSHGTEFGEHEGLGYVAGLVERIPSTTIDGDAMPVPHISWGPLNMPKGGEAQWKVSPFSDLQSGVASAYFVHSYQCTPENKSTILAETVYGGRQLTAAIMQENFIGLQFHPERSGEVGQRVLKRFMNL